MPFFTIATTVQVGAEPVQVTFDDPAKLGKVASELRKMHRRLTPDAQFQVRTTGDGRKEYTYLEFYSPTLKAKKQTSKGDPPDVEEFPYFIKADAPWVKTIARDKAKECGYSFCIMYDWGYHAKAAGLEPNLWYAAEYVEGRGTFRPLDPSSPLAPAPDYRLGDMQTPIQRINAKRS